MRIDESLIAMRKESGKTQAQIARYIEVSIRTWINYEQGVSDIPAKKWLAAARFCRYDISLLIQRYISGP
ncbi:MAG: transcriptional regulator with XRE-family HTH domain [Phenylobacterium sp.]|jgi:transcriptional regulator with XRE-family HTH domain